VRPPKSGRYGLAYVLVKSSITISGLLAKTAKCKHENPFILVCKFGFDPLSIR
jgi:hypothetical protein